jgi:hypothetical protein
LLIQRSPDDRAAKKKMKWQNFAFTLAADVAKTPASGQISSRHCHSAGMYRANLLTAFDTADFDRRGEVNVFTCS